MPERGWFDPHGVNLSASRIDSSQSHGFPHDCHCRRSKGSFSALESFAAPIERKTSRRLDCVELRDGPDKGYIHQSLRWDWYVGTGVWGWKWMYSTCGMECRKWDRYHSGMLRVRYEKPLRKDLRFLGEEKCVTMNLHTNMSRNFWASLRRRRIEHAWKTEQRVDRRNEERRRYPLSQAKPFGDIWMRSKK